MHIIPKQKTISPRGRVFGRPLRAVVAALFNPLHYLSIVRSSVYENVLDSFFKRYVLGRGDYPYSCLLRTPSGVLAADAYSHYDMLTINEIFTWKCYANERSAKIVVDFGSNIGISVLYFICLNPESFVYAYEPLATNCIKLRKNLSAFSSRYNLIEAAVCTYHGQVDFAVESTGRYSGIGLKHSNIEKVACVDARQVIKDVVSEHGKIDILKVDIEGAERDIFQQMDPEVLSNVEKIYIESDDFDVSLLVSMGYLHKRHPSGVHHFSKSNIDEKLS